MAVQAVVGWPAIYVPEPELPAPPALARAMGELLATRSRRLLRRRPVPEPAQVEGGATWPEATPDEAPEPEAGLEPVPMAETAPARRRWPVAALSLLALLGLTVALWPGVPDRASELPPVAFTAPDPLPVVPALATTPVEIVTAAPEPAPVQHAGWLVRRVRVGLSGDASAVALVGERGAVPLPGELRPGTYTLRVTFPGWDPMDLRQVEIEAGRRYEIACTAKLTQCRAVDVP